MSCLLLRLLSLVLFMNCFTACSSSNRGAVGKRAIVSAPQTAFYKYGPAQSFGPDFVLKQGAAVTILESSWGYSRVMTLDGTSGFVAADDLHLAPVDPPRTAATNSGPAINPPTTYPAGKPKHSNLQPTPGSPLFEAGDLPSLPEKNEPSAPSPRFRF